MERTVEEVCQMAGGRWLGRRENVAVRLSGVSTDSRNMEKESLFVPLAGDKFDGHQFVSEALKRGASASFWQEGMPLPPELAALAHPPLILVKDSLHALQKFAGAYRRQLPVCVVGVTGSNGKTTTKDLVAAAVNDWYRTHKTQGNLNNHIGVPLTLLAMPDETEVAVVEMGMSGRREIALLSRLARPEIGIITNIGEAHLMQLGSREAIAQAKMEITEGMTASGTLLLNGDEPLLAHPLYQGRVMRFGFSTDNDIFPLSVEQNGLSGIRFTTNLTEGWVYLPLPGRHNVCNALAAILTGKLLGVGERELLEGLAHAKTTGMRIEVREGKGGIRILNDAYNASPASMRAALSLLKEAGGHYRKVALLGDMLELGHEEERLHREIAKVLSPDWLDELVTVGERSFWIADAALESGFPAGRVHHFASKDAALTYLLEMVSDDVLILVKASRGMRFDTFVEGLGG